MNTFDVNQKVDICKVNMAMYAFDQTLRDTASQYTVYVDSSLKSAEYLNTFFEAEFQKNNHFDLTVKVSEDHKSAPFNTWLSLFIVSTILADKNHQIVQLIKQLVELGHKKCRGFNDIKLNNLTKLLKGLESLMSQKKISDQKLNQAANIISMLLAYLSQPSEQAFIDVVQKLVDETKELDKLSIHLIDSFARLLLSDLNKIDNTQAYQQSIDQLIKIFESTLDFKYGNEPLLRQKVFKILADLKYIEENNGSKTELLNIYTLLMMYLDDPKKEQNQDALILKCSELAQHEQAIWRPLSFDLAWLHLQESQDATITEAIIKQKMKICKQTLTNYCTKSVPLRAVIDNLLVNANEIKSDAEQLELLQVLEVSINLLAEPTKLDVQDDFKEVTNQAQGKASVPWRTIGGILAAIAVLIAVVAIIAVSTPISFAAGVALLLTLKTMLASHFVVAMGTAAVSGTASICCFYGGREKGMHKAMTSFDKTVKSCELTRFAAPAM